MKIITKKQGIATVLGMLIFIGVLFTVVIPLFIYVNDVNLYLSETTLEMKSFDEEREEEKIAVFAYPLELFSDELSVCIKNRSPLNVEIIRVWINDECYNLNLEVQNMLYNVTDPININSSLSSEKTTVVLVKVTTRRGNVVASQINPLFHSPISGWSSSGMLSVNVVLSKEWIGSEQYNILVTRVPDGTTVYNDDIELIGNTVSFIQKVLLPQTGTYHVKVTQEGEGVIREKDVTNTWDDPEQWVYANSV